MGDIDLNEIDSVIAACDAFDERGDVHEPMRPYAELTRNARPWLRALVARVRELEAQS